MQNRKQNAGKEIDIEFKDLCLEILRRWRIVVVCALAGGVLLGAIQYQKDYRQAHTAAEEVTEETTTTTTLEEAYASLNKDEIERVIAAVQLVASIDARSLYMSESVLMDINPYAENAVLVQYSVGGDGAQDIVCAYRDYIANGGLATDAGAIFSSELSQEYLSELITVTKVTDEKTNNFTVKVVYSDEENAVCLAEAVKSALEEYCGTLVKSGQNHTLTIINESTEVLVDTELAEKQDTYANDTLDEQTELSSIKANMSANQLLALLDLEKDIFPWNNETEADETAEDTTAEAAAVKVSVSGRKVAIGAAAGAVVAVVYVFLAYLMSAQLRTEEELRNLYGVRVLGNAVTEDTKRKRIFGAIDEAICRLGNRERQKMTDEQQLAMLLANLSISCRDRKIKKLSLTGNAVGRIRNEWKRQLQSGLKEKQIELEIVADIICDADSLEKISETKAVLLAEEKRVSYYDEIMREMQLCEENDIDVLGFVVLGE